MDAYCAQMSRRDCVKAITRWREALDWWRTNRPDHVYAVESLTEAIEAAKRRIETLDAQSNMRMALRKQDAQYLPRNEGIVF